VNPSIKIKTPAKLILSGEHAVVHGAPALGTSLPIYTTTSLYLIDEPKYVFQLENLKKQLEFNDASLLKLKQNTEQAYQNFLKGELEVKHILKSSNLLPYILAIFLEKKGINFKKGAMIKMKSDIPMGIGLGSSASVISGLIKVLSFEKKLQAKNKYIHLAQQIEHLVHGKSSGFDIEVIWQEGCLYKEKEKIFTLPKLPFPIHWVNTGRPESNTLECVNQTKALFQSQPQLLSSFSEITHQIIESILQKDKKSLKKHIMRNHRLLCDIGVVPKTIQTCIAELEKAGNVAKVCGAGSIRGEKAGALWILGEHFVNDILKEHGFYM
jgi:hydroxymethylglutaryl-CoA synthase